MEKCFTGTRQDEDVSKLLVRTRLVRKMSSSSGIVEVAKINGQAIENMKYHRLGNDPQYIHGTNRNAENGYAQGAGAINVLCKRDDVPYKE